MTEKTPNQKPTCQFVCHLCGAEDDDPTALCDPKERTEEMISEEEHEAQKAASPTKDRSQVSTLLEQAKNRASHTSAPPAHAYAQLADVRALLEIIILQQKQIDDLFIIFNTYRASMEQQVDIMISEMKNLSQGGVNHV